MQYLSKFPHQNIALYSTSLLANVCEFVVSSPIDRYDCCMIQLFCDFCVIHKISIIEIRRHNCSIYYCTITIVNNSKTWHITYVDWITKAITNGYSFQVDLQICRRICLMDFVCQPRNIFPCIRLQTQHIHIQTHSV